MPQHARWQQGHGSVCASALSLLKPSETFVSFRPCAALHPAVSVVDNLGNRTSHMAQHGWPPANLSESARAGRNSALDAAVDVLTVALGRA
jgi:hypothetical protein